MKRNTVYVITEGTEGYMSDNVAYFGNKRDAQDYAQSLAEDARDNNYRVSGNKINGYVCTPKWSDHPLDTVIEIDATTLQALSISDYSGLEALNA